MTGSEIKAFREHWGLTQEDLAEELGVTSVSVSRWECGINQPHASFMSALKGLSGKPSAAMRKKRLAKESRCVLSCVKA